MKDSKKFLIINNEDANICIWFSFIQDKQSFVKNLQSLPNKINYIKDENQEDIEQEEEQSLQEDDEDDYLEQDLELEDQNLAKLLQIPDEVRQDIIKTNLIQLIKDPQLSHGLPNFSISTFLSQPQAQNTKPQKLVENDDEFFANIRKKHFEVKTAPISLTTEPQRQNLVPSFQSLYGNTNYNTPEFPKPHDPVDSPFSGNLIGHIQGFKGMILLIYSKILD